MLRTINDNYFAIQDLRDSGYGAADFEVSTAPVEFQPPGDTPTLSYPNKEVCYRTDTMEPIAVHGPGYKILQNREMIDKTRDMIERCDLDATDIEERIQVSPNGGMCLVNYKLPAKEYVSPDGDKGCVEVMALSSFNGVWSFILSLGFQQSACLNSQIFIKNPASIYKARHTNKLDIDKGVHVLGKTANIIENEIQLWHEWYQTPVSDLDVAVTFMEVSNFNGNLDEMLKEIADYGKPVNTRNKALTYLYTAYNNTYFPRMGRNKWALYNSITDWSTHAPSSSKNVIALSQRRTEQATRAIDKYLLNAA